MRGAGAIQGGCAHEVPCSGERTMPVGGGGDYARGGRGGLCMWGEGGRLCAGFFGILLQAIDDVNVRNKAWKLMYVFRWADCEF